MTTTTARRATTEYTVTLTLPDGAKRDVMLSDRDLATLNHVSGPEAPEVKQVPDFARLARKGLVKHRFVVRGDWTAALVEVTPLGLAALRLGRPAG